MRRGAVAVIVLVGMLGCQRSRDRATESFVERVIASRGRESKVTIDREHGSITVDLGGATKPEGWPAAVPLYPHARSAKIEAQQSDVRRLALITDDSPAAIGDFYSQELARLGWHVEGQAHETWIARRGAERLEVRVSRRESATRAEIEYRASGSG